MSTKQLLGFSFLNANIIFLTSTFSLFRQLFLSYVNILSFTKTMSTKNNIFSLNNVFSLTKRKQSLSTRTMFTKNNLSQQEQCSLTPRYRSQEICLINVNIIQNTKAISLNKTMFINYWVFFFSNVNIIQNTNTISLNKNNVH